jgi:hypothetical protein
VGWMNPLSRHWPTAFAAHWLPVRISYKVISVDGNAMDFKIVRIHILLLSLDFCYKFREAVFDSSRNDCTGVSVFRGTACCRSLVSGLHIIFKM